MHFLSTLDGPIMNLLLSLGLLYRRALSNHLRSYAIACMNCVWLLAAKWDTAYLFGYAWLRLNESENNWHVGPVNQMNLGCEWILKHFPTLSDSSYAIIDTCTALVRFPGKWKHNSNNRWTRFVKFRIFVSITLVCKGEIIKTLPILI